MTRQWLCILGLARQIVCFAAAKSLEEMIQAFPVYFPSSDDFFFFYSSVHQQAYFVWNSIFSLKNKAPLMNFHSVRQTRAT